MGPDHAGETSWASVTLVVFLILTPEKNPLVTLVIYIFHLASEHSEPPTGS